MASKKMIPEKRYLHIMNMLQEDGTVQTKKIKDALGVSFETVRRDLNHLENEGRLFRVSGGAVLANLNTSLMPAHNSTKAVTDIYMPFDDRSKQNLERKRDVAELAATLVNEGDSLALDSGTTALELAKVLKSRFKNLTIVTNSLNIADELSDASGFTIMLTGGILRRDERSLVSDMATLIFQNISVNTFFMTTCGVSAEKGVTYQRLDEMSIQLAMLEVSEKAVLITDSSKIGINSLIKMCDLEDIHAVVTDSGISQKQQKELSRYTNVITTEKRKD